MENGTTYTTDVVLSTFGILLSASLTSPSLPQHRSLMECLLCKVITARGRGLLHPPSEARMANFTTASGNVAFLAWDKNLGHTYRNRAEDPRLRTKMSQLCFDW